MRADKFFSKKYGSRTKAAQALERGLILRGDKQLSPADEVRVSDIFTFIETSDFVSNGGKKLEKGLAHFQIDVAGKVFADLGASTGGFTDCLLRRGARRVYCVDVGTSQLDRAIAEHRSVIVVDDTNARYLKKSDFPEKLDGVVSDLSFISLELVLPAVYDILEEDGEAFVLFKPQFECGGKNLTKRGILPLAYHKPLLEHFFEFTRGLNLAPQGIVNAPLREKKNVEYIVYLRKGGMAIGRDLFIKQAANIVNS